MKYYVAAFLTAVCFRGFAAEPVTPNTADLAVDADVVADAILPMDHEGHEKEHKSGACSKINLDDAQKAQLKEAIYAMKKEGIQLKANLQLAVLEYGRVLSSTTSEKGAAEKASGTVQTSFTALGNAGFAFVNNAFFGILKAEQRPAAASCMKAMMHHKKAAQCRKYSGRHHHGKKPGSDLE